MPDEPLTDAADRFHVDFSGRTLLGVHRVERRLAEGGMGVVYQAMDTNLGRPVVVKVPHVKFLAEPGFRTRFRREVEELVRLEHPHVVRILAQGEEGGVPFFVLQYLAGGSLEDRLAAGPQTLAQVRTWLPDIARTLDYVHERGVVHRDVKPGNVLFDEVGHVFLSDFGVVKALGGAQPGITAHGVGIGSAIHMAPEQAFGRELTGAADQYALASTVFEALAGEPPFGSDTVAEIVLRKTREAPPSLSARAEGVPRALDDVFRRAFAQDPASRHPTCGAFADALARASSEAPPPARARSPWYARTPAALGLLAVALVLGLLLATRPGGEPDRAPPPRSPSGALLRVVDRGQEPRDVLRYTWSAGSTERATLAGEDTTTVRRDDVAVDVPPESRDSVAVVVAQLEAVEADGSARVLWSVEDAEGHQDRIPFATSRLGPHGQSSNAERSATDRVSRSLLDRLVLRIPDLAVMLPEEPIGVGAVWDVTRPAEAVGIRYMESLSYRLLSREGRRLRLEVSIALMAPAKGVAPERVGPGGALEVRKLTASGYGSVVVDLDHVLPAQTWRRASMRGSLAGATGEKPWTMSLAIEQTERSHREGEAAPPEPSSVRLLLAPSGRLTLFDEVPLTGTWRRSGDVDVSEASVEGPQAALERLRAWLGERARRPDLVRDDRTSALLPILQADALARWRHAAWVFQEIVHRDVFIDRVRLEIVGEDAAVSYQFPHDRGRPRRDLGRRGVPATRASRDALPEEVTLGEDDGLPEEETLGEDDGLPEEETLGEDEWITEEEVAEGPDDLTDIPFAGPDPSTPVLPAPVAPLPPPTPAPVEVVLLRDGLGRPEAETTRAVVEGAAETVFPPGWAGQARESAHRKEAHGRAIAGVVDAVRARSRTAEGVSRPVLLVLDEGTGPMVPYGDVVRLLEALQDAGLVPMQFRAAPVPSGR